jgi:hypothetical protein
MSGQGPDLLPPAKPEQDPESVDSSENWVFPIASLVSLLSWCVFAAVSGFGALMVIVGLIGLVGEEFTGAAEGYNIAYGSIVFVIGIILAIFVFMCLKILILPIKNKMIVLESGPKISIGDANEEGSLGRRLGVGEVISSAKPYFPILCVFALLTIFGILIFGTDRFIYVAIISLIISGYFRTRLIRKLPPNA